MTSWTDYWQEEVDPLGGIIAEEAHGSSILDQLAQLGASLWVNAPQRHYGPIYLQFLFVTIGGMSIIVHCSLPTVG